MFKYRPHRGSLDESMKEAKEFITMDQMFDYIVMVDPLHVLQKEDLYISEDHGKDIRIDWSESRNVMAKRYGKNDYPQPIGWCSMEDTCIPEYFAKAKDVYIGGFSRHRLLKMLYDAAKPYDKTISIDEAADALKNTVDMVTELKGKKLYVNVFGKEFDGTEYDKINGIGLSYHIVAYMRHHLLFGKYPWEEGIPNFEGDLLDVIYKVLKTNIPDAMTDKEDKLKFGQTLAKVEADRETALKSFKTEMGATMEPELVKQYKDILKNKDDSIVTAPVQNVYEVTCTVGLDVDFILIRAESELEAWNKFWEHFKDEPNLNHEDFGSKEDYEYGRGYWKKKGSIVSITIEPIKATSDFLYIGGGRTV